VIIEVHEVPDAVLQELLDTMPDKYLEDAEWRDGWRQALAAALTEWEKRPRDLMPLVAGHDVPAGKRLYASRDLKGSAFELAVDQHLNGEGWHLETVMRNMLVITKPTYAECLAELMRIWQNWDREGKELPAARTGSGRAISGSAGA
jgi:hypothetical protein